MLEDDISPVTSVSPVSPVDPVDPVDPIARPLASSNEGLRAVQPGKSMSSTLTETKIAQNAAILQASLDVSLQTDNQSLTLLLKSAINGINELLKPEFGDNALQAATAQDNTPAGTADRMVSLSTGFFDAFKQQHVGENAADVLSKFMVTIRGGFESGAREAQGILKGMGVLNGDIASNIDQTLTLVQQGYADFEAAQRALLSGNDTTRA